MPRKTPPCPLYPKWTQAKFKGFIKSLLRKGSTRWPPAREKKLEGRRRYTGPNKRQKFEYHCEGCGGWFPDKEIAIDHITPVGGFSEEFENWSEDVKYIVERLFVNKDGYQRLCKNCHYKKTQEEKQK